jgi:3-phosphoshikimate 1-carboxyvinyltransferase
MDLVTSPGGSLHGAANLPGDKSISHRAALFAGLALGDSRIENFLVSGVTRAMLDALTALGVAWEIESLKAGAVGQTLIVHGRGMHGMHHPNEPLNCGNSATTIRMMTGALAAAGISAVLDGSPGLRRRPMDRIVDPLRRMGVEIESTGGCAPLTLSPSSFPLHALDYDLPVASAQLKTCLLLAALAADGVSTLRENGPSRDHTERMLRSMGVSVIQDKYFEKGAAVYRTRLAPPGQVPLKPLSLALPGDFSSAAFIITAALITPGSDVTLHHVGLNPARTGLLDALLAMGGDIRITSQALRSDEPVGDLQIRHSRLHGTQISGEQVVRMIDEFPIFAVAAAYAEGATMVSDAAELRVKESDRISMLCAEMHSLGVEMFEKPDGFVIQGFTQETTPGAAQLSPKQSTGWVRGGLVQPHGDHRLAMSLAVAGLASAQPVQIQGAEIIHESFPEFVSTLQALGGNVVYA